MTFRAQTRHRQRQRGATRFFGRNSLGATNGAGKFSKNQVFVHKRSIEMIANRLKASFDHIFPAPIEVWEEFASFTVVKNFKKNQIIKHAGEVEQYGYFNLKGSAGTFLWKENSYVCLDLYFENSFFADYMSLITNEATPLETVVLEASEFLCISRGNINRLKQTPMGLQIFLISAERSFVDKQKQQIDLLTKTAEQRYLDLLSRQPDIVLRTPNKHLASYLGITPQSLSRIRKHIM
jgi:CRP-like cAMP-binding protein